MLKRKNTYQDQLRAAYALNLCSVSVSQIIDYNDITILEQEYEAILNNLNLEHMPKDGALLNILEHLLETITFFRIQEGEKQFIEKEYQQNMKNAIWSAVPNIGLLVAGGNPVTMAISLASQVGTGYMNYRKKRTEYQAGRDKQLWQLRVTAMEQLQSLQQQLFETSWKLADKYAFPDNLRLTERQIKRYNAILMDPDELRKYERLEAIKEYFAAYPPFWYYLGNTANTIANSSSYHLNQGEKGYYREEAKKYYKAFCDKNEYNLLREDNIAAACYLEYADLLDVRKDAGMIKDLIGRASKAAISSMDVLQLCAIGYLRIGEIDEASEILRVLVNEGYNTVTNAQLLSTIYVDKYIRNSKDVDTSSRYKLLEYRVGRRYLFPMPHEGSADKKLLQEQFITIQRDILREKYSLVLQKFKEKYRAAVNRIIPLPEDGIRKLPDNIYADTESDKAERVNQVKLIMENKKQKAQYIAAISQIEYSYELLQVLNQMFSSLCLLEFLQDEDKQEKLEYDVKKALYDKSSKITECEQSVANFDAEKYKKLQEITLDTFAEELFTHMDEDIAASVNAKAGMQDFSIAEENLSKFCKQEGFDDPEVIYAQRDDSIVDDSETVFFAPDLLKGKKPSSREERNHNSELIGCIKMYMTSVVSSNNVAFYTKEDAQMSKYFKSWLLRQHRAKTLAVLDDRSLRDLDLLFTSEGIKPVIWGMVKKPVEYKEIVWKKDGDGKTILIGEMEYKNDNIDMERLYDLIRTLASISDKYVP